MSETPPPQPNPKGDTVAPFNLEGAMRINLDLPDDLINLAGKSTMEEILKCCTVCFIFNYLSIKSNELESNLAFSYS